MSEGSKLKVETYEIPEAEGIGVVITGPNGKELTVTVSEDMEEAYFLVERDGETLGTGSVDMFPEENEHARYAKKMLEAGAKAGRKFAEDTLSFRKEGEDMAADAARKVSVTLDYEWGDDGDIRIIRVKDDE